MERRPVAEAAFVFADRLVVILHFLRAIPVVGESEFSRCPIVQATHDIDAIALDRAIAIATVALDIAPDFTPAFNQMNVTHGRSPGTRRKLG